MAPLKMLGCTVAIGGTAARLLVARRTRYRPGLCPPGALPAPGLPAPGFRPGFARPGLARAHGARLDSAESARPRPPCPWP